MLPVLMYHGLHANQDSHGRYDPVYSLRPDDFARQLDWLLEHGYRCAALQPSLFHPQPDGERRVLITFDDGDVSNYEVALPLLRERGMTAEFFVTSDFIGQPGMLEPGQVCELHHAGMGIGSHGRSHAFLEDLPADDMRAELGHSQDILQGLCGTATTSLALPGGRGGARERQAATGLGYRYLFGSVPGPNRHPQPGKWLQRLAMTRELPLQTFAALVQWQGLTPRAAQARFYALALPKKLIGNRAYERLRARLL